MGVYEQKSVTFVAYNISNMGLFKKKSEIPPPDQWGAKTDQCRLLLDKEIPFEPDIHDVIYVENEFDPVVNDYIEKHYEELQQQFRQKGIR